MPIAVQVFRRVRVIRGHVGILKLGTLTGVDPEVAVPSIKKGAVLERPRYGSSAVVAVTDRARLTRLYFLYTTRVTFRLKLRDYYMNS